MKPAPDLIRGPGLTLTPDYAALHPGYDYRVSLTATSYSEILRKRISSVAGVTGEQMKRTLHLRVILCFLAASRLSRSPRHRASR